MRVSRLRDECFSQVSRLLREDERIPAKHDGYVLLVQEEDMGDIMSGKASESIVLAPDFREAIRKAVELSRDETSVAVLGQKREMVCYALCGRLFYRRYPE